MEYLRPNRQRAQQATTAFWILLGIILLSMGSNFLEWQLMKSGDMTAEDLKFNTLRQALFMLAALVIQIFCIVFFILWFRRAYANLHRLGTLYPEHEDLWAGISWFIPIINLYRPYYIMKEIWVETQEAYKGEGKADSQVLLGVWWALFLSKNVVNNVANRLRRNVFGINGYTKSAIVNLVGDVLTIVAILVTIKIIQQMIRYEMELYQGKQQFDISQHLVSDMDV